MYHTWYKKLQSICLAPILYNLQFTLTIVIHCHLLKTYPYYLCVLILYIYGFGMDCSLQKTHVEKKRIHYGKDFPEIMTAFAFYGFIWAQRITSRPRTITKQKKWITFMRNISIGYSLAFLYLYHCLGHSGKGNIKAAVFVLCICNIVRYCIFIAINILAYWQIMTI